MNIWLWNIPTTNVYSERKLQVIMRVQSLVSLSIAILVVSAPEAFAWGGWGGHGGYGVPGPIAGAGLGYLAVAGGYYLFHRWRKQKAGE